MDKIRNNIKLIIGIIVGIVIACNSIVFAYTFASAEIRHVKSDNTETSVDVALNELYDMYTIDSIILNKIYPVGSYYISASNTSPADIFGGTWVKIKDKFLLSSGDTYSNGDTGGSSSNILAANQIPTLTGISGSTSTTGAHTHTRGTMNITGGLNINLNTAQAGTSGGSGALYSPNYASAGVQNQGGGGSGAGYWGIGFDASKSWSGSTSSNGNHSHTFSDGSYTNSNQQSVNNMPPYKVVNIWERTA